MEVEVEEAKTNEDSILGRLKAEGHLLRRPVASSCPSELIDYILGACVFFLFF